MTEKIIHYLDNSATTRPSEVARRAFFEAIDVFGNPSSLHSLGAEAARLLASSREKVSLALGARPGSAVVFTASGTEANNLMLLGYDYAKKRIKGSIVPTVLISDSEHPSVREPAFRLREKGYRVIEIPTAGGRLDTDFIRKSAAESLKTGGVSLASFMLVGNETGALYDIKTASDVLRGICPEAIIHTDAVQGFMKTKFTPSSLGVDCITVSSHKIHAPRGAGVLYISPSIIKRREIASILPGGGQENGFRSGTENLCAISAFASAAEDYRINYKKYSGAISDLRKYFEAEFSVLESRGVKIKRPYNSVSGIINITLPRIKSQTMLSFLSGKGICVSAGSACSASSGRISSSLLAFGCTEEEADSSLRISLSHYNTKEDIDAVISALAEGVGTLQKF